MTPHTWCGVQLQRNLVLIDWASERFGHRSPKLHLVDVKVIHHDICDPVILSVMSSMEPYNQRMSTCDSTEQKGQGMPFWFSSRMGGVGTGIGTSFKDYCRPPEKRQKLVFLFGSFQSPVP